MRYVAGVCRQQPLYDPQLYALRRGYLDSPDNLDDMEYLRFGMRNRWQTKRGFPGNEPERFVSNYRKAGGDIEITYFDNEKRNTDVTHQPVLDFVKKHTK